jgi:hypothetical protein
MRPAINLFGRTFGRLTVIAREGSTGRAPRRALWRCRCSCSGELAVRAASLLAGRTRSCGCLRAELARGAVAAARAQRWAVLADGPSGALPDLRRIHDAGERRPEEAQASTSKVTPSLRETAGFSSC